MSLVKEHFPPDNFNCKRDFKILESGHWPDYFIV